MGYCEAMEAAGAEVLAYQEFGSYQGDWWAKVSFEGSTFWVHGAYGSCSGCDAFQAEFNYCDEACEEHRYDYPPPDNCTKCEAAKADHQSRLAAFGLSYLTGNEHTQAEAEKENEPSDWDPHEEELTFLKNNAIEEKQ